MPTQPITFIPSATGPLPLNSMTEGPQQWSSVVPLSDGRYVATWNTTNIGGTVSLTENALMGRIFDASGNPLTAEFRLDDALDDRSAYAARATALADGGFAVLWDSYDFATGSYDIGVAQFDADGNRIGPENLANTDVTEGVIKDEPDIAALSDGGYVAVWQSWFQPGDDSYRSVHGQRYDALGNKVGSEFQVNQTTDVNQSGPQVAGLAGGGFVVIFNDESYGSPRPILARLYDADGAPVGDQFVISGGAFEDLVYSDVAALPGGGFVAVWQEFYGGSHTIYGGVFDANGVKLNDFTAAGSSGLPYYSFSQFQLQPLPDGTFVLTYLGSDASCLIQHFDGSGNTIGDVTRVDAPEAAADYGHPAIALLDNGDLIVSWSGFDADQYGVFNRVVEAWWMGTADADTLTGDARANRMNGLEGNDTIRGMEGDDTIWAGNGNDTVMGSSGDDVIHGQGRGDSLIGGAGNDALFGEAGGDTLRGKGGNDSLDGGNGNDRLWGGAGDDLLTGGAGADSFVFVARESTTRITDFEDGIDQIDLSSFGFADAEAALAFAVQSGRNVVFTFTPDNVLTVDNITLAQFTDADFILS